MEVEEKPRTDPHVGGLCMFKTPWLQKKRFSWNSCGEILPALTIKRCLKRNNQQDDCCNEKKKEVVVEEEEEKKEDR